MYIITLFVDHIAHFASTKQLNTKNKVKCLRKTKKSKKMYVIWKTLPPNSNIEALKIMYKMNTDATSE